MTRRLRYDKARSIWGVDALNLMASCPPPWAEISAEDEEFLFSLAEVHDDRIRAGANGPHLEVLCRLNWATDREAVELVEALRRDVDEFPEWFSVDALDDAERWLAERDTQ